MPSVPDHAPNQAGRILDIVVVTRVVTGTDGPTSGQIVQRIELQIRFNLAPIMPGNGIPDSFNLGLGLHSDDKKHGLFFLILFEAWPAVGITIHRGLYGIALLGGQIDFVHERNYI